MYSGGIDASRVRLRPRGCCAHKRMSSGETSSGSSLMPTFMTLSSPHMVSASISFMVWFMVIAADVAIRTDKLIATFIAKMNV